MDPLPKPIAPVLVSIGGLTADIQYAGAAPGYAGLMQLNAWVPTAAPSGDVPVVVSIGGVSSQTGVTLAIR